MKTLTLTITIIVSLTLNQLKAQKTNHLEIEIDPIAYALGGASGHVAYTWKNERIQLGYGQLTLPESMQSNEDVQESFKAISLKWDYFFFNDNANHGFFAGPTFDYLFLSYEDKDANSYTDNQLAIGLRLGYKFDLFKKSKSMNGLYVTPWIGASYLTTADDIELGSTTYNRNAVNIFPTVHLGWSF